MSKDSLKDRLRVVPNRLVRFRVPLFILAILLMYGFIVWRAADLTNAEPDPKDVAAQTNSLNPHIDQATLGKIQDLQDNSVSARSLFNQARQNPFKE